MKHDDPNQAGFPGLDDPDPDDLQWDPPDFDEREPPEEEPRPQAHARRTDPETSHEAAASIKSSRIRESHHAVRQLLLVAGPMTDHKMIEEYRRRGVEPRQSDSGLRSRRAELVAMKPPLVRWTGRWFKGNGRRRSRVWEIVPSLEEGLTWAGEASSEK